MTRVRQQRRARTGESSWLATGLRVALLPLLVSTVGCRRLDTAGGAEFEPADPDVLTVATANLPAPGFWEGPDTTTRTGFEAELALALATELGVDDVRVVQVDFPAITRGDLGGADVALTQMTPTAEREAFVDFTTPYLRAQSGVLARVGVEARDAQALQGLQWVVVAVSTLTPVVEDSVRPDEAPIEVSDRAAALAALQDGRADAVMLDLPVAAGLARSEPEKFVVLGHLGGREGLSVVLPDGSPNLPIVDSAVRKLVADGTVADLEAEWLGSAGDVPLIRLDD